MKQSRFIIKSKKLLSSILWVLLGLSKIAAVSLSDHPKRYTYDGIFEQSKQHAQWDAEHHRRVLQLLKNIKRSYTCERWLTSKYTWWFILEIVTSEKHYQYQEFPNIGKKECQEMRSFLLSPWVQSSTEYSHNDTMHHHFNAHRNTKSSKPQEWIIWIKFQFIEDIKSRHTNKTTICMVIYRGKRQIRAII